MKPQLLRALSLICLSAAAHAQWSTNPAVNLAIADFNGDQAVPLIAASGDGSTWMAWFDNRGGSYAVYAQRLDVAGIETFAHGGMVVSSNPQNSSLQGWDMISDGAGGCVIAFTDVRNGPDLDVYAYRLDAAGNQLWGANGVTLSSNGDSDNNPVIARTTDGSFVFAWTRNPSSGAGEVLIQKLDAATGTPQYAGAGVSIPGPASEKPAFVQIAASDSGSYIVAFVRDITSFSSPRHIHAQKLDAAGTKLWNSGNSVIVYDQNAIPIAHQPQLRSDGAGGAVLAWHRAVGTNFEVMNQRLSSSGVEAFAHNGLSVCLDTTIELNPALSIDPASGDAFVFFVKENSGQTNWSLSVQRVTTTGTLSFGSNAVDLIPIDAQQKAILKSVPYADGAACVCFRYTGTVTHELIGFRVDGTGASVWGASPVVLSSVVSGKLRVALASDASGVLRTIWGDNRNDVTPLFQGYDTYAQHVNGDGTLNPPGTPSTGFCFGDGTGTACPCGNSGSAGNGCANSSFAAGARLSSGGIAGASVGTDSLVLTASDIPGPGLFFQGDGQFGGGNGITFGDGLLCAGGTILRLGVVFPTGSSASYPGGLTPNPIHVGGATSAGDVRHYQCWYRDAVVFCSVDTYNLTQGLTLTWGP